MARTPLLSCAVRLSLLLSLTLCPALARGVAVGGTLLNPVIETKTLPSGREGLPVWFLARLNVAVQNDPGDLRLAYGGRSLRFTGAAWSASGFTLVALLPAPEIYNGSLHVGLDVLRALGLPLLADTPDVLDFAGTPAAPSGASSTAGTSSGGTGTSGASVPATPPTSPPAPLTAQLGTIRSSRRVERTMEYQRLVLELSAPVLPQQARDKTGLTLTLPGVGGAAQSQKLESGDTLVITPQPGGLSVRLNTGGGTSTVFTLSDPFRVVVDTVTNLDPSVPPPPDPSKLPPGVVERQIGKLHLVSFDPALYRPQVVSAPLGSSLPLADLVARGGGVAGVNGGYFDPASRLPVDLVALGGLMTAPSLERRATLGLDAAGRAIYGYPRPRYILSGAWGEQLVNTVSARPNPTLLTLFVGDGRTPTGSAALLTLSLVGTLGVPDGALVTRAQTGVFVPAAGQLTLSFDPARFPQLPRTAGASLGLRLDWRVPGWDGVQQALSAGPLLVSGGQYAVDPAREGFNTLTGVWRSTRQAAFGTWQGRPTIAYFENGTPEEFARALAAAGVSDALRMDSGSSATVYYAGGYLNTVWSSSVVNAIVMVPRTGSALGSAAGQPAKR